MTANTLIVLGIVSVAAVAYFMTLWTGRREWDWVKAAAVICLAWMAMDKQPSNQVKDTPFVRQWLTDVVNRAEQIHREQQHAISANRSAQ